MCSIHFTVRLLSLSAEGDSIFVPPCTGNTNWREGLQSNFKMAATSTDDSGKTIYLSP